MTDGDIRFVAFLRGINVGGHHKIKMTDLKRMFEALGFHDVQTIIASGNVVFSSEEKDHTVLAASIERSLASELGYEVRVMLRSMESLRELVRLDPFAGYDEIEGHRYVGFYPQPIETELTFPVHVLEESYSLLTVRGAELFLIAGRLPGGGHGDFGKFAARAFGEISTTRNWNTIVKITQL